MNLRFKIITAILVTILVGVTAWRFLPKPNLGPQRDYFMGVDGDPRMRVCESAKGAENATPEAVSALKIDAPLQINPNDKANYRVSVFYIGGKAMSIEFSTPKAANKAGFAKIGVYENGVAKFEEHELNYEQSVDILNTLKDANIWGELKRTFEPRKIKAPATAVIEIQAPTQKRCVATRYDDERVRPILAVYKFRVASVLKNINIEGFAPPKEKILGKEVGAN